MVCLILAAVFVVPWSNLMRSSDVAILEFYEKALQDIQSGPPSPEASEQLKEQNAAYVAELSAASGLSMTARQLLRAGRDHLLPALAEARSPESEEQELLEQRVKAARAFLDGSEIQQPELASDSKLEEMLGDDAMMGGDG